MPKPPRGKRRSEARQRRRKRVGRRRPRRVQIRVIPPQQHGRDTNKHREAHGPDGPPVPPEPLAGLVPALGPAQLGDLAIEKDFGVGLDALGRAGVAVARRLEHARGRDGTAAPRGQGLGRVSLEQLACRGDEGLEVQGFGKLAEDAVQHLGLVVGRLEELGAARAHDGGEHVHGEHRFARQEHVEQPGNFAQGGDVVGVHGQGAAEGEEGFRRGQVPPQGRVGGPEDVGDEAQLGDGGREGGKHEVADAEGREPGHGGGA